MSKTYELQEEYNELIIEILNNYIEQKDYEISEIEKKGKVSKNQIFTVIVYQVGIFVRREVIGVFGNGFNIGKCVEGDASG